MAVQDQILQLVRLKGPLLPIKIASELKLNTTFAGAYLSELTARKLILISNAKIGGSPVYYVKEQIPKLQALYEHLNEKDQKAFELLRDNKVLEDKTQTPLMRVALRNIKDFAVPLQVRNKEEIQLFWKWYLVDNSEAESLIKAQLGLLEETKKEPETQQIPVPSPETTTQIKSETITKPEHAPSKEKPKVQSTKKENMTKEKAKEKKTTDNVEKQAELVQPQDMPDPFFKRVKAYLSEKDIEILNANIIRKNSEIDLLIRVPSVIGKVEYYCKAKSKKKSNEGDLSSAFVQGQLKKLPVLYLTTGELTKKSLLMLEKEFKNHVITKKL